MSFEATRSCVAPVLSCVQKGVAIELEQLAVDLDSHAGIVQVSIATNNQPFSQGGWRDVVCYLVGQQR